MITQERWDEIKEEIKEIYQDISDLELDETEGNFIAISELIQSKYDDTQENIEIELKRIFRSEFREDDDFYIEHPTAVRTSAKSENQDKPTSRQKSDTEQSKST